VLIQADVLHKPEEIKDFQGIRKTKVFHKPEEIKFLGLLETESFHKL
jgi:hypothetical protein